LKHRSNNISLNFIFKIAIIAQIIFSVVTTVSSSDYDLGRKVIYWLLLIAFVLLFPSKSKKTSQLININPIIKLIILLVCGIQVIIIIKLISNQEVLALSLISREDFFSYDFLTNIHGGKIPFMLRFYLKQIALLGTVVILYRSTPDKILIGLYWLTSMFISVVSGGRFVFLEFGLFLFTLGIQKKVLRLLFFLGLMIIIGLTYIRTGGYDSLFSALIGLDFAYEVAKITPDYGYFSRFGIVLDHLNGMSTWSWIKYGSFLNDFLYYNPILDSSFNAYGTLFIIPLAELGITGFIFFLLIIITIGWILRGTIYSDAFVLMLTMGLFQFNILWYPVVYLFVLATFLSLIKVE
jgi:hypothetical protein